MLREGGCDVRAGHVERADSGRCRYVRQHDSQSGHPESTGTSRVWVVAESCHHARPFSLGSIAHMSMLASVPRRRTRNENGVEAFVARRAASHTDRQRREAGPGEAAKPPVRGTRKCPRSVSPKTWRRARKDVLHFVCGTLPTSLQVSQGREGIGVLREPSEVLTVQLATMSGAGVSLGWPH